MYSRWGASLIGGQRVGHGYHSAGRWPVTHYVFGEGATTLAEAQHNFAPITYTGGDNGTYLDQNGDPQNSGTDIARIDYGSGLLIEEQRINHFLNSGAPATQTSGALGTGNHTLWMVGAGSVAVAGNTAIITGAGTATEGSPVTFNVTVGGTVDYTVTGSPTRAQSEKGAFATSYIPTAGSSVTRTPDVATIALSDMPGFNAVQGGFYWEGSVPTVGGIQYLLFMNDGAANTSNAHTLFLQATGELTYQVTNGAAVQATLTGSVVTDGETIKIFFGWKANSFYAYQNGTLMAEDIAGTPPTGQTTIQIGDRYDSARTLNGHNDHMAIWNIQPPQAFAQAITV